MSSLAKNNLINFLFANLAFHNNMQIGCSNIIVKTGKLLQGGDLVETCHSSRDHPRCKSFHPLKEIKQEMLHMESLEERTSV